MYGIRRLRSALSQRFQRNRNEMNAMPTEIVLDAKNQILGRFASYVAKQAIEGNKVIVLNAEKVVISGRRSSIVEKAKRRLETRTHGTQSHAPVHQRRPDLYFRRVVRGMLPWDKPKGRAAFHRVWIFMGVPEKYVGKDGSGAPQAGASRLTSPYVTLEDLAKEIGG